MSWANKNEKNLYDFSYWYILSIQKGRVTMMEWFLIVGFAISSSIDNLGVGMSYGIRDIRINWLSNLVIATICFLFSEGGILFGNWLSAVIPGVLPDLIAAFILFAVGVRIILLALPRTKHSKELSANAKFMKPQQGKFAAILENPEMADMDHSQEIGFGEAILLGIVLSANALTNGLSAGLIGLSPLAISLVSAVDSFIAVWAGVYLGHKVVDFRIGSFTLGQFGTILSGIILLLIAAHALW
jgi:putative sporulation protein YtaF